MDYLFVRTKLQGVIALELIRSGVIRKPFVFTPMYRISAGEDTASVQVLYQTIAREAYRVRPLIEASGLFRNSAQLAEDLLACWLTRGTVFVSVVNSYAVAVALKTNPFCTLMSFDDGTANVEVRDNSYLSLNPLPAGGVKRWLARKLFPNGAAAYCRSRISKHFTIYPDRPNIVSPDKLVSVELRWSLLLSESDKRRVPDTVRKILIGTVYDEVKAEHWRPGFEWAISRCDLYLPHPREKTRHCHSDKVLETGAPAESLISYLLERGAPSLTLYHFGSSVALSFVAHPNVVCVDLLSTASPANDRSASHA
jgi:hypothetical protein